MALMAVSYFPLDCLEIETDGSESDEIPQSVGERDDNFEFPRQGDIKPVLVPLWVYTKNTEFMS